jgi:hypothetical protein
MHTDSDAGLRPPILNSQDVLPFWEPHFG